MALDVDKLATAITLAMSAQGFVVTGDNAFGAKLATAVATAVVAHITSEAEVSVEVTSGSSAATYTGTIT